jgi:hypothetical protein
MFVEGKMEGSEIFTNVLVVIMKTKVAAFAQEMNNIMPDHYAALDETEAKRIKD